MVTNEKECRAELLDEYISGALPLIGTSTKSS